MLSSSRYKSPPERSIRAHALHHPRHLGNSIHRLFVPRRCSHLLVFVSFQPSPNLLLFRVETFSYDVVLFIFVRVILLIILSPNIHNHRSSFRFKIVFNLFAHPFFLVSQFTIHRYSPQRAFASYLSHGPLEHKQFLFGRFSNNCG